MTRVVGSFILGFFLAVFLMTATIKVELGPMEAGIQKALPYMQQINTVTHGAMYGDVLDMARWVNSTADKISQIPLIGGLMPSEVGVTSDTLINTMNSAKIVSENILSGMEFTLFLLQMTVPLMVLSAAFMVVGAYLMTGKCCEGQAKAAPARKPRK